MSDFRRWFPGAEEAEEYNRFKSDRNTKAKYFKSMSKAKVPNHGAGASGRGGKAKSKSTPTRARREPPPPPRKMTDQERAEERKREKARRESREQFIQSRNKITIQSAKASQSQASSSASSYLNGLLEEQRRNSESRGHSVQPKAGHAKNPAGRRPRSSRSNRNPRPVKHHTLGEPLKPGSHSIEKLVEMACSSTVTSSSPSLAATPARSGKPKKSKYYDPSSSSSSSVVVLPPEPQVQARDQNCDEVEEDDDAEYEGFLDCVDDDNDVHLDHDPVEVGNANVEEEISTTSSPNLSIVDNAAEPLGDSRKTSLVPVY